MHKYINISEIYREWGHIKRPKSKIIQQIRVSRRRKVRNAWRCCLYSSMLQFLAWLPCLFRGSWVHHSYLPWTCFITCVSIIWRPQEVTVMVMTWHLQLLKWFPSTQTLTMGGIGGSLTVKHPRACQVKAQDTPDITSHIGKYHHHNHHHHHCYHNHHPPTHPTVQRRLSSRTYILTLIAKALTENQANRLIFQRVNQRQRNQYLPHR